MVKTPGRRRTRPQPCPLFLRSTWPIIHSDTEELVLDDMTELLTAMKSSPGVPVPYSHSAKFLVHDAKVAATNILNSRNGRKNHYSTSSPTSTPVLPSHGDTDDTTEDEAHLQRCRFTSLSSQGSCECLRRQTASLGSLTSSQSSFGDRSTNTASPFIEEGLFPFLKRTESSGSLLASIESDLCAEYGIDSYNYEEKMRDVVLDIVSPKLGKKNLVGHWAPQYQGCRISQPQGPQISQSEKPLTSQSQGPKISHPQGPHIAQPQGHQISQSQKSLTSQPQGHQISQSQKSLTSQPHGHQTSQSQKSLTSQPQGPQISHPQGPHIVQPQGPHIAQPQGPHIAQPQGLQSSQHQRPRISQPPQSQVYQPPGSGIFQFQGPQSSQCQVLQITQPQIPQSLQSQGRQNFQFQGPRASQPQGYQTSQFQGHQTSQFQRHQTSQLQKFQTSQLQGHQTSQPQRSQTSQFQGPKTSQPQGPLTLQHQQRQTSLTQRSNPMWEQPLKERSSRTGVDPAILFVLPESGLVSSPNTKKSSPKKYSPTDLCDLSNILSSPPISPDNGTDSQSDIALLRIGTFPIIEANDFPTRQGWDIPEEDDKDDTPKVHMTKIPYRKLSESSVSSKGSVITDAHNLSFLDEEDFSPNSSFSSRSRPSSPFSIEQDSSDYLADISDEEGCTELYFMWPPSKQLKLRVDVDGEPFVLSPRIPGVAYYGVQSDNNQGSPGRASLGVSAFFNSRSIVHRLGPHGMEKAFDEEPCSERCGFAFPVPPRDHLLT